MKNLIIIILSLFLISAAAPSDTPVLEITKFPQLVVYEPKQEKANISIYLHGGCGFPKKRCGLFAGAVTPSDWLICPGANFKCKKPGGRSWSLIKTNKSIENSVEMAAAAFPERVNKNSERTIIGYSQGAIVASQILQNDNKYKKGIIISAFISLKPSKLKNKKVILMSGKKDMTYKYLKGYDKRLRLAGIDSKFVSLGNIGHDIPKNISEILNDI